MVKSLPRIPVPKEAYEALGEIIDVGEDRVRALVGKVSETRPSFRWESLLRFVAVWGKELEIPQNVLEKVVFRVLIPANGVRVNSGLTAEQFINAFRESVEQGASEKWRAKYGERWPSILEALEPLLVPDNFFGVVIKTGELLFDHPTLFRDVNVLTDLRPVYDEAAEHVRSLLLTNTLVLRYSEADSKQTQRTLFVTLDLDDLRKMVRVLERAKQKNEVAQREARQWKIDILTASSEET